jgi:hypothetical protein
MSTGLYDRNRSLIWNFLRGIITAVFGGIVALVCVLIRAVSLTNFDGHKVTRFKIWRIRKLTGLKLWFFHNFPEACKFLDLYGYLKILDKKFNKK